MNTDFMNWSLRLYTSWQATAWSRSFCLCLSLLWYLKIACRNSVPYMKTKGSSYGKLQQTQCVSFQICKAFQAASTMPHTLTLHSGSTMNYLKVKQNSNCLGAGETKLFSSIALVSWRAGKEPQVNPTIKSNWKSFPLQHRHTYSTASRTVTLSYLLPQQHAIGTRPSVHTKQIRWVPKILALNILPQAFFRLRPENNLLSLKSVLPSSLFEGPPCTDRRTNSRDNCLLIKDIYLLLITTPQSKTPWINSHDWNLKR